MNNKISQRRKRYETQTPICSADSVDPYFSVWSPSDVLTDSVTVHWTGHPNTIVGTTCVDGTAYRFLGKTHPGDSTPALVQTARDCDALSTRYTLEGAGIILNHTFTTPPFPRASRRK